MSGGTDPRIVSSGMPAKGELAGVVHRNIAELLEVRRSFDRRKSRQDSLADAVTRFTGSMAFVWIHAGLFAGWLLWNTLPGTPKFDPYPFVMLAMVASVEAIFLSTFVLISQNRQAALAEKRAELDLQINLLAEHEVTRLIALSEAIALKLGVEVARDLGELKRDVAPGEVLEQIENAAKSPAH
ncbi:MAG: DUF1003 domain-containing protein [Myxococcales bacterium]